MSTISQSARRLFRSQNLSAFKTYSPAAPIARLHQQGPTRSAVVHNQALPSQTESPPFLSQTQSQSSPVAQSPHRESITLETLVSQIPLVQTLRETHSTYKETPSLRGRELAGPGKLAFAPYMWLSTDKTEAQTENANRASSVVSVFHIGQDLCGHPGFVHGGLLTVLFDEVFARCASAVLPSGLGMTANLNVDFRKPALPDRMYVLRTKTVKVEGRKSWVEGRMTYLPLTLPLPADSTGIVADPSLLREDSEGAVMVAEAKALFIEPKFADSMVKIYSN
ncbi:Thioesterase superfamily [Penicillium expansum]|nr:Thioesterase superfamily [Penicillium expansum]